MTVCFSGDLADAEQAIAPIRALGDPIFDLLREQPYTSCSPTSTTPSRRAGTTTGAPSTWPSSATSCWSAARALARECPIPDAELGFLHVGGALNERAADDGAVGNRDARYAWGVDRHVGAGRPGGDATAAWVRDAGERVRPFSTGGNYVNFQTADEGDDARPRRLRRELRPPRRDQAPVRSGQPVPLEPQHQVVRWMQ